jgi:general secretion pathway protein K
MMMLSQPDPQKRWRSDGMRYIANLPDGQVSISVADESAKIDINAASEQTLRAMLNKLMGNDEQAAALTDKILDWRDQDDLKRTNGAEAKDYQAEGKAYVPQNKNFQALEELQMVLGMTPALYKRLEPLLTIYTGQDGINPQKASAETLQLLLGIDPEAAANFVTLRRASPITAPPPLPTVLPGAVKQIAGGDVAYTFRVQAQTEEGPGAGLQVVARRQFSRNNGAPFAFVAWKQQIFGAQNSAADTQPPPR